MLGDEGTTSCMAELAMIGLCADNDDVLAGGEGPHPRRRSATTIYRRRRGVSSTVGAAAIQDGGAAPIRVVCGHSGYLNVFLDTEGPHSPEQTLQISRMSVQCFRQVR